MGNFVVVRRRRGAFRRPAVPIVIVVLLVSALVLLLACLWGVSDARKAKAMVVKFYAHEQNGEFGSSWELFHPQMKALYPKEAYIEARTRLMQQLGARPAGVEIGDGKKQGSWRMAEEADPVADVYRIEVAQRMDTVFGRLEIRQAVFAAKADGQWTLLWPFGENA